VLLSFGSIEGGFEFAMALRWDIMKKFGKKWEDEPHFVYLDAISLEKDPGTKYTWMEEFGIYKMSNEDWEKHYKTAMIECAYMIFLISMPWLNSKWCWGEYDWYLDIAKEKSITPIFVIFQDAEYYLRNNNSIKYGEKTRDLKNSLILTEINNPSRMVHIYRNSPNALKDVPLPKKYNEEETRKCTFNYVCSEAELNQILSKIS
jgi:hypothetical protein